MNLQKHRIQAAFSQAEQYDSAATVQAETAIRLARRISARFSIAPARVLEIGCGTGLLSQELAAAFPASHLTLTDISLAMLERCQARLGPGPAYQVMDGEDPRNVAGPFDLIASSLAMQWFTDLPASIAGLTHLLAPNGILFFATLGSRSFEEWRQAHSTLGLPSGLHDYPSPDNFPLPTQLKARIETEVIAEHYPSARAFARALKTLGASTPRLGHRPLPANALRQVLASLNGSFTVSYQILYVEITPIS